MAWQRATQRSRLLRVGRKAVCRETICETGQDRERDDMRMKLPRKASAFNAILTGIVLLCPSAMFGADGSAAPSPPKVGAGPERLIVDQYTEGQFSGGFHDPTSSIDVTVVAQGDAKVLKVAYEMAANGWVGIWHQVGMAWNQPQDWSGFESLILSIYSTEAVEFSTSMEIDEKTKCQGPVVATAGRGWEEVQLAAGSFVGLPGDVSQVRQLVLNFRSPGKREVRIGWMQVIRDPKAVKDWVDLRAFAAVDARPVLPARSATFHVSGQGDDNGDGSEQRPFKTVNRGVRDLRPGDTLLIHEGFYTERADAQDQAGVRVALSGTRENPITIKSASEKRPVITSASWGTIRVQDSCHVVIDGLEVTTTPIMFEGKTSNVGNGISAERSHHITIRNCIARGCGGNGIGSMHSDYITVVGNQAIGNAFEMKWQGSGISLYQHRDFDRIPGIRNIVSGNICYLNENKVPTDSGEFTDGNGIIVDDFRNSQGDGPHINYQGSTVISDNLCYNNGGRGIHVFLSDRAAILNNTVHGNGRTLNNVGELSVWYARDIQVVNNIASSRPHGCALSIEGGSSIGVWKNIFHAGSVAPQWMPGNTVADPRFVNPGEDAGADFRLQSGSPAIDAADAGRASSGFDLLGIKRPFGAAPDAGAYEWVMGK